jgi:KaiC domain protein
MKRAPTGITGLDEMMGGGIPEAHIVTVLGPPGSGKSTLALQFIHTGLENNENCVYLSLEEDEDAIVATAASFGWDLKPYIEEEKLALTHFTARNIKATVERAENEFLHLLESFNTKRIAIDSITLYEMIHNTETERRERMFNLAQMIKDVGSTALVTSEINPANPYYSRYGLVEYLSDGVIILHRIRNTDTNHTTSAIEILKMRRIEHSREIKPYTITSSGFVVHSTSEVFL